MSQQRLQAFSWLWPTDTISSITGIALTIPYYAPVGYSKGNVSLPQKHHCDKKCDRKFVTLELYLSLMELLFKDDIQSGILFWIYMSQSSITGKPDWITIGFSVCSIIAHSKLATCFVTKLCGCGKGEVICCENSVCSVLTCILGLIGSIVFLVLTVLYLHNALNPGV